LRFPLVKEENISSRKTNLNDVLRAFGCFCIVWYHSGYYWELSQTDRIDVDKFKLIFISWAMPFFYTSSFYFAANYGFKKVHLRYFSGKLAKLTLLLLSVVGIYQAFQLAKMFLQEGFNGSLVYILKQESFMNLLAYFWHQISTGSGTPAYFIFEIILMYPICYMLGLLIRKCSYSSYLVVIFFGLLGVLQRGIFEMITHRTSLYLALAIAFLVFHHSPSKFQRNTHLVIVIAVSVLTVAQTGEVIWPVLAITILFKSTKTKKLMAYLSDFGQKYSLFVFCFHFLALEALGIMVALLQNHADLVKSNILVFVILNFLGFLLTYAIALIIKRKTGFIFAT
jgi:hypothetical protein